MIPMYEMFNNILDENSLRDAAMKFNPTKVQSPSYRGNAIKPVTIGGPRPASDNIRPTAIMPPRATVTPTQRLAQHVKAAGGTAPKFGIINR